MSDAPSTQDASATPDAHGEVRPYRWAHKPLGIEAYVFVGMVGFFVPVVLLYGFWSGWEPVGSLALGGLALMWGMVGYFLILQGRKVNPRPEDHPHANVEDHPGVVGVFAPFSWWPLVLGIACTFVFLGLALGWWLVGIGLAIAVGGVAGHAMEFARGPHAH